jgi:hypothetical protein
MACSMQGQIVYSGAVKTFQNKFVRKVDLTGYSVGTYVVRLVTGTRAMTLELIVR